MKNGKLGLFMVLFVLLSAFSSGEKQEPMQSVVNRGLNRATEQALLMAKELKNREGRFPKTINKKGELATSDYAWWCSGFFPGELWYLYENHPDKELRAYAEMYTNRLENAKKITYSHDVGFMLNCSFGNGYRLTKNPHYKDVMTTGANSLATRFKEEVGLIRSWDFNKKKWQFPVIIDNMMNLEFFTVVSRLTGNDRFRDMAISHADKTMEHHFRPDYSCYHVVSYDTITGKPHIKQTHQGYADESAWARGQAWALYGFTMMYKETGKKEYLKQANHIARFIMNHPRMPEDKVPYWDFDAPDIPNAPRDASAAAIMASALLDLSQMNPNKFGKSCRMLAEQQLRSLTSPEYLAKKGGNCNFVLLHSTGHFPNNSEVDVPLSYADYYYVEALIRMKKLLNK
ncbi:MAG: glycoside hydrolase family 88 protein [Bacteroides sp.]|uniref:glycoside hydrolase family 88 protein n=1 Tax=Bacteroides sp. TaxID=29523 RepID=UPI002FCA4BB8